MNSLDKGDNDFARYFNEVQGWQTIISRAGYVDAWSLLHGRCVLIFGLHSPFGKWIPRKTFYEGLKHIDNYVNFFINRVLTLSEKDKDARDDGYTFLHALSQYTSSRKVMRDQLVAVLLAGRDTTASTLSFLFAELSRHPEVFEKLKKEILSNIGPHRAPSFEDIRSCTYLQKTISETLRIYPAVPYNVRLALKDTSLPRGGGQDGSKVVGIKKNTPIAYAPFLLQRDPQNYPPVSLEFPNIETFCPERWNAWTPKPWTYIPFNGGPRICIGQQFALTEIGYTVVRLLQRFSRIVRYWKDNELLLKTEIVISPANGVKIGFWEAEPEKV